MSIGEGGREARGQRRGQLRPVLKRMEVDPSVVFLLFYFKRNMFWVDDVFVFLFFLLKHQIYFG